MDDARVQAASRRIVVAEDNRDLQQMLRMTLELGDFEVVGQAHDGREALVLVRELQPDLLLLDLHMPDVGGLEVIAEIAAIAPACKVVIHSAVGAMFMTEAALEAGAVAYIEKGVAPRSVLAHLDRVTRAGGLRPPVRPYPLRRDYIDG